MKLLNRLASELSPRTQRRGSEYHLAGAVSVQSASESVIDALVQGGRLYRVQIERQRDGIRVSCTCPYVADGFEACKHVWAVLVSASTDGLLDGWAGVPPYLILDDEYGLNGSAEGLESAYDPSEYPMEEEIFWDADRHTGHIAGGSSSRPQSRGGQHWKWAMQEVREAAAGVGPVRGAQLEGKQIIYLFDPEAIRSGGGLFVEIAVRGRKKDGTWGKSKTSSVGHGSLEKVEDPVDRRILTQLLGAPHGEWGLGYHETASRFRLLGMLAGDLVPQMCETGRCMVKGRDKADPVPVSWDAGIAWQFVVEVRKQEDPPSFVVDGLLFRGEERVPLSEPVFLCSEGLMLLRDSFVRYEHHGSFGWILALRRHGSIVVPSADSTQWLKDVIRLPSLPPMVLPEELRIGQVQCAPTPCLRIRYEKRRWPMKGLVAELSFDYGGAVIESAEPGEVFADLDQLRRILRDRGFESAASGQLKAAGFKVSPGALRAGQWEIPSPMLGTAVRQLLLQGWRVDADGKAFRRPGSFEINVTSGIDWFELHGSLDFEGRRVPFPRILEALKKGDSAVILDDGTLGMIPEDWMSKYGLLAGLGKPEEGCLRFSRGQVGLLDALLASQAEATCDAVFQQVRDRLQRFSGITPADPPPTFMGELRPYQRDGLGWLDFLRDFGFGGCLADDMGLGKTVQVLALLEARRMARHEQRLPPTAPATSLVVVPKSLVFNWKQEAARFTPALRILDHTGSLRMKAGEHFESHDVALTTYGTLRRDAPFLKDLEFDYVILDEAQAIKNADTASAKAVRLLRGRNRLALSGTPVENHLGELWSLFEFLNPGILGSSSVFRLGSGALRNPDEDMRRLLARALRPFILRRTKEQVAADLPPKQEQTLFCDLDHAQRKLYDELREYYRQSLLSHISDEGIARSKIQILEALLRLRQAACHPGLIDRKRTGEPSAKLDLLLPQIREVLEEDHKILVFSQFTSFLAIVRERLDAEQVRYEYLDGETRDRRAPVERFQNDLDCRLFLISLRAGGLGLNLTAAEYVYLLDPWWNPAVESQAIDRTHRIGQTRPVFAYRVIARDTVEEKVLALQKTKRDLADAIIGADGSLIRDLSREDLELLLS